MRNVALQNQGTTCKASSNYPGFTCYHAIDGRLGDGPNAEWASYGDGTNAWITLTLPHEYWIVKMKITPRRFDFDRAKEVKVSFDSTQMEVYLIFECVALLFTVSFSFSFLSV